MDEHVSVMNKYQSSIR